MCSLYVDFANRSAECVKRQISTLLDLQVAELVKRDEAPHRVSASVKAALAGANPLVYEAATSAEVDARLHKAEAALDATIDGVLPQIRERLAEATSSATAQGGNVSAESSDGDVQFGHSASRQHLQVSRAAQPADCSRKASA